MPGWALLGFLLALPSVSITIRSAPHTVIAPVPEREVSTGKYKGSGRDHAI